MSCGSARHRIAAAGNYSDRRLFRGQDATGVAGGNHPRDKIGHGYAVIDKHPV